MPFTFSHPLFSVPLKRVAPRLLSMTGLVLGSMIPDMEYFMAMESYQTIGHSFRGFVLQGLPLSIAFAFAFHRIVKPVLPRFLPAAGKLDQFAASMTNDEWKLNSVRTWASFLASLYIGYLTHMFMDAWTHDGGVFVRNFAFLHEKLGGQPAYQLLQYLFSLIGVGVPILLLLSRYIRWRGKAERLPVISGPFAKIALWTTAAGFGFVLLAGKILFATDRSNWVSALIVAPLSAAIFGFFAASLLYRAARNRKLALGLLCAAGLLIAIVVFRISEYTDAPSHWQRFEEFGGRRFKGVSQPHWNVYLWCWSALVILGCGVVTGRETRSGSRDLADKKAPFV